jgi:hypothetical protein
MDKSTSLIEQIRKGNVWDIKSKEYKDAKVRNDIFLINWQFLQLHNCTIAYALHFVVCTVDQRVYVRIFTEILNHQKYIMFAPAQLLRTWREQRPSNKSDLDSSATGEVGKVYYMGVDLLLISFRTVVRDCCWVVFLNFADTEGRPAPSSASSLLQTLWEDEELRIRRAVLSA